MTKEKGKIYQNLLLALAFIKCVWSPHSDLQTDLGMLSIMFSSFLVTSKKNEKKKNKFAVTQSNSKVDLFWPYSKINLAGLTAFSFQATVSATHPLHRHCQQERHWYLCMRFHDTVHMRENSLVHAYGSCTLQRHSQLHSCSGSSWARTLEQPVDQWSQQSPGYR